MAQPFRSAAYSGARFQELADTLGISLSWLYSERDPPPAGDALELIRLYATIDDAQGRQRLMSRARGEAARSKASKGVGPMSGSSRHQGGAGS